MDLVDINLGMNFAGRALGYSLVIGLSAKPLAPNHLPHQLRLISTFCDGIDMAPPRGSATYKKQDGTLAVSRDGQSVSWTPVTPPGTKPSLTMAVSTITSLSTH